MSLVCCRSRPSFFESQRRPLRHREHRPVVGPGLTLIPGAGSGLLELPCRSLCRSSHRDADEGWIPRGPPVRSAVLGLPGWLVELDRQLRRRRRNQALFVEYLKFWHPTMTASSGGSSPCCSSRCSRREPPRGAPDRAAAVVMSVGALAPIALLVWWACRRCPWRRGARCSPRGSCSHRLGLGLAVGDVEYSGWDTPSTILARRARPSTPSAARLSRPAHRGLVRIVPGRVPGERWQRLAHVGNGRVPDIAARVGGAWRGHASRWAPS